MKTYTFINEMYKNDFGSICTISTNVDGQEYESKVFLTNKELKDINQYKEITFEKVFKFDLPIDSPILSKIREATKIA